MTTIVETYGDEALAEILSILRERARRSGGSFLIGEGCIKKIVRQRFGLTQQETSQMLRFIEKTMFDNNIFELWGDWKSKGLRGQISVTIYQVDVSALDEYSRKVPPSH